MYSVDFNGTISGEIMDPKPYDKESTRHHRKVDNPLLSPEPVLLELFE